MLAIFLAWFLRLLSELTAAAVIVDWECNFKHFFGLLWKVCGMNCRYQMTENL